jgi:hypothetical protein
MKPAHNQIFRQVLPDTSSSITSPNIIFIPANQIECNFTITQQPTFQVQQLQPEMKASMKVHYSINQLVRQHQITKGYRGIIMIILRMCIQRHDQL